MKWCKYIFLLPAIVLVIAPMTRAADVTIRTWLVRTGGVSSGAYYLYVKRL